MELINQSVRLKQGVVASIVREDITTGIITVKINNLEKIYYLPVAFENGEIMALSSSTHVAIINFISKHNSRFEGKQSIRVEEKEKKRERLISNYIDSCNGKNKYAIWEAIRTFRNNWNIEEEDFAEVIRKSFSGIRFISKDVEHRILLL